MIINILTISLITIPLTSTDNNTEYENEGSGTIDQETNFQTDEDGNTPISEPEQMENEQEINEEKILEIKNEVKYIDNDTRNIGISIIENGLFYKRHNFATFIVPQYLGNYSHYIKDLTKLADRTIEETTAILRSFKHHFKGTQFEEKTKSRREKICLENSQQNTTTSDRNISRLCNSLAYNNIIKRSLYANIEVYNTTKNRITKLDNRMQEIIETFTPSERRGKRSFEKPLSFVGQFEKDVFDLATGEDIRKLRAMINNIGNTQGAITSAMNSAIIFDDWHKKHLLAVEEAVRQMQQIIKNLSRSLKTRIDDIDTTPRIIINMASITTTTSAFININNIASTLEQEIQRLANSIEQSINGNLNIDTISPNTLYASIKNHENKLKSTEEFLWKGKSDIVKIYENAKVNIYRCETGEKLMITFTIPIINKNTYTTVKEINIFPFTASRQANIELIINIDEKINQIYVTEINNQIFNINKEDIIDNKRTSIYKKNKLQRVNKKYRKCIKEILTKNITEILKQCGTKQNLKHFIITRTNTSTYTFYSKNTTEIQLHCPVIKEEKRMRTYKQELRGYGTLSTPQYCTLQTPETTFLGEPVQLAKILIKPRKFRMTKLINQQEINTELWTTIINTNNKLKKNDLIKIIQDIEKIELINGTEYDNATKILRKEIMLKIKEAEHHLGKTIAILEFMKGEYEPTVGSVFIITTILIIVVTYLCIRTNRNNRNMRFKRQAYPIITTNNLDAKPLLNLNTNSNKRLRTSITKDVPV